MAYKSYEEIFSYADTFWKVCRTCATTTELIINIFDGEGAANNLAEKIQKYLPIKVSQEDELPLVVCYQCASTIIAWHELVTCCIQADTILQDCLNKKKEQETTKASGRTDSEDRWWDDLCENTDIDKHTLDPLAPCPAPSPAPLTEPLRPAAEAPPRVSREHYERFYSALVRFREHFVRSPQPTAVSEFDDLSALNRRRGAGRPGGGWPCSRCGKRLGSAHTLSYHVRIHRGERPCVCHVCGRTFRAPPALRRHLAALHEAPRPPARRHARRAGAAEPT